MMNKYQKSQALRDLPRRLKKQNKSHAGKSLIIAGSQGMWGAAVLAAKACARTGSGYTYILDSRRRFPSGKDPDFLTISSLSLTKKHFSAIALGPGLNNGPQIIKTIQYLIQKSFPAVVLDAEALNALAKTKKKMILPKTWVLTPHEGELARLLKISSEKIRSDRLFWVKQAQKKFGCVVLLKGFHSLVADHKKVFQIMSGNPALAKAGTGDVLTGMVTAFLAQGLDTTKASCLAAYLHGKIADDWLKNKNDMISLMASDLVDQLPATIHRLRKK
jgi:NAD(P)H-hydrate epimerase